MQHGVAQATEKSSEKLYVATQIIYARPLSWQLFG
jgi:hypothetical protein